MGRLATLLSLTLLATATTACGSDRADISEQATSTSTDGGPAPSWVEPDSFFEVEDPPLYDYAPPPSVAPGETITIAPDPCPGAERFTISLTQLDGYESGYADTQNYDLADLDHTVTVPADATTGTWDLQVTCMRLDGGAWKFHYDIEVN